MTARRQNPPAIFQTGLAMSLALIMSFAVLSSARAAPPMAAHRAVYDLLLDADPSRPMVETARGRIVFEFSGSPCEGYTQNFRQVAELAGSEFGQRTIDSRSLSFEEADSKSMHYSGSVTINNGEPQETDGSAEKRDGGLKVMLIKPETETVSLKSAAMFPTEHYQRIIAAASKGDTVLESRVFDGNGDGKTISDTLAVIGKVLPEKSAGDAIRKAGFASMKRWPITVSYFDGDGQERETPSYMMSMELLENGIADALVLNYGDFVLKGLLRQIEILPQRACP